MLNNNIKQQEVKLRARVLQIVNESPVKLTGREIAKRAGLNYKQTIDALDALNNYGMIQRIGKKFNTRWMRKEEETVDTFHLFESMFADMRRKRLGIKKS